MCTCHNYNQATKQFDFIPAVVPCYGCVICQSYHYEGDELYVPHIYRQSKHGIVHVTNPKRRDWRKLQAEGEGRNE